MHVAAWLSIVRIGELAQFVRTFNRKNVESTLAWAPDFYGSGILRVTVNRSVNPVSPFSLPDQSTISS